VSVVAARAGPESAHRAGSPTARENAHAAPEARAAARGRAAPRAALSAAQVVRRAGAKCHFTRTRGVASPLKANGEPCALIGMELESTRYRGRRRRAVLVCAGERGEARGGA